MIRGKISCKWSYANINQYIYCTPRWQLLPFLFFSFQTSYAKHVNVHVSLKSGTGQNAKQIYEVHNVIWSENWPANH